VTSNPRCLCVVLGGGASSLGVTINNTHALELPGVCSVKTPPASQCKCELINIQPVTYSVLAVTDRRCLLQPSAYLRRLLRRHQLPCPRHQRRLRQRLQWLVLPLLQEPGRRRPRPRNPPAARASARFSLLPLLSSPQHLPFSMLNDLFRFECWDRVCDLIFKTCGWSPSLCLSCMFSWRGRVGDQCGHMYALYVFFAK
jgi:hypothetical protein